MEQQHNFRARLHAWPTRSLQSLGMLKRILIVLVGLSLAACSSDAPLKPAPSSRFVKSAPVKPTPEPETKIVAKAPEPVEVRIYPEPSVLDGLSATKVRELLGTPGFKRSDEPAEIWQYRVTNCTLDLFMYETLDSEQRSVAHFEMRPGPGQTLSTKACFVAILQAVEARSKSS